MTAIQDCWESMSMVREHRIFCDAEMLVKYVSERFAVDIDASKARRLVDHFTAVLSANRGWAVDADSSAGHVIWLSSRLAEMGCFNREHRDPDEIHFAVELHFWSWEGSPWATTDSASFVPDWPVTTRRSPLSRLCDSSAIDRVARRIAGDGDKPCPYCRRYFRNPAALVLHLRESHSVEVASVGNRA